MDSHEIVFAMKLWIAITTLHTGNENARSESDTRVSKSSRCPLFLLLRILISALLRIIHPFIHTFIHAYILLLYKTIIITSSNKTLVCASLHCWIVMPSRWPLNSSSYFSFLYIIFLYIIYIIVSYSSYITYYLFLYSWKINNSITC